MTLFAGGVLHDGTAADVRTDVRTGLIVEVAPPGLVAGTGEPVVDCRGLVVLDAPAEPHAHLDKALSRPLVPRAADDLPGAIAAWHDFCGDLTMASVAARAECAARELVAHGVTAIRTHVDVNGWIGLAALDGVAAARDRLRDLVDIEIVVLSGPVSGHGRKDARVLAEAGLDRGGDLVGGCPHLNDDPVDAIDFFISLAADRGCGADLHVDETTDPSIVTLNDLVDAVSARALPGVTASHCLSQMCQPPPVQEATAAAMAACGMSVVTLPATNLWLNGREGRSRPWPGAWLRALRAAGVTVAAGADNVRDPFCPVGRADPFETAALLVLLAHLTPDEAWTMTASGARAAIGAAPSGVSPGCSAELLAVEGSSLADALARASDRRVVVHRGRVVSDTRVERWFAS